MELSCGFLNNGKQMESKKDEEKALELAGRASYGETKKFFRDTIRAIVYRRGEK